MNQTSKFCEIVRKRSNENNEAMSMLFQKRLYGQVMSILRQELDSMIRCIFLLGKNLAQRNDLISQTLEGKRWRNEQNRIITDRDMVEISNSLQGWTKSVYKFGCAFIHLSNFHDYQENDPFEALSEIDRNDIKNYLNYYHGFNLRTELTFASVSPFLKSIFDKINSNLECYVSQLENEELLTN